MRYLLDTGVLLRLVNREADGHAVIRQAVRTLRAGGDECVCALQNLCEFWNVSTRPATSRGGMGQTFEKAQSRLKTVERIVTLLPEEPAVAEHWKLLVFHHQVQGVQVHDTRLVATMEVAGVVRLLTLNTRDSQRFTSIKTVSPGDVVSGRYLTFT